MPKTGKNVDIQINTTEEHLASLSVTMEQVQNEIAFLMQTLGDKYFQLLLGLSQTDTKFNFDKNLINRSFYLSSIYRKICRLEGFNRHLKEYSKTNIDDHLFTARVASWLLDQDYTVEMEPENEGRKPDLLITMDNNTIAVECKNPDISAMYDYEGKKDIADIVFEKVKTCDQINLYFYDEVSPQEISDLLSQGFVSFLYGLGLQGVEARFCVSPRIEISLIPQPPIIGAEEEFLTDVMGGINVNRQTSVRLPGFAFMQSGRSVQICGPAPDYRGRWNRFRSKSKKQAIDDLPMIVIVNGDNVVNSPELHHEYIQNCWLTEENKQCSGVGILYFTTLEGNPKLDFFENKKALYSARL